MARHGENIRKRKDGRWEGRYLVYSKEKDKQLYRSVYGRTYEEVKEKLLYQKSILKGLTVGKWGETAVKDTLAKEIDRGNTGKKVNGEESVGGETDEEGSVGKKMDVEGSAGRKMDKEGSAGKKMDVEGSIGKEMDVEGSIGKKTDEEGSIGKKTDEEGSIGKKTDEEGSVGKKIDVEGNAGKKIDVEGNVGKKIDVEGGISKKNNKEGNVDWKIDEEGSISKKINDEESIEKTINNEESAGEKINNGKGMERENAIEEICFGTIAEEWLEKVKITRKTSTYIKYHLIYRNYLETALRNTGISRITNQVVQEKISGFLSESMGKSVYCVLNQILKYASEKYALKLIHLKRPVSYMPKKPVETFSRKELSALLSVLYQEIDLFKCAVLLCLCTGLRLGEMCALKWEDIDMENQLIAVSRTVQRLYAKGYATKTILLETAPKSIYSSREIPLPSVAFSALKEVLLPEGRKEYVFGGDKPAEPRTMQNHFKRMLEKAGIPHKNFHTLRHTFSTNCIEGGTDVKSLSEILGHSDVQITLNRYIHPSMDMKRRHLDTLSEYYRQISGSISGQVCGQPGSQSYGQAS